MSPGAEVPYKDYRGVVVGPNCYSRSVQRSVVGTCIAYCLCSRVALAPEILYFAPLSSVTKQEPQKTQQALFVDVISQHLHCLSPILQAEQNETIICDTGFDLQVTGPKRAA